MVKEDPIPRMASLAKAGVILTPPEFQNVMLHKSNPKLAKIVITKRIIFSPQPLANVQGMPSIPMPSSLPPEVSNILSSIIENRGFSPRAVRFRMGTPQPNIKVIKLTAMKHPELDRIGDLYNKYRLGVLNNMGNVSDSMLQISKYANLEKEVELSKDASAISSLLFSIGYWPFSENSLQ